MASAETGPHIMQTLLIDVTEVAGNPGASMEISVEERVAGLGTPLGWVDEREPVRLDLVAEAVHDGVAVSGEISGRMQLSCCRCLLDFDRRFQHRVDEVFYFEADAAESEDGYVLGKPNIADLEPMLRDAVVLAIPIRPLHDEDCKGLCTVCGTDLNTEDCGHAQRSADVRWAPLADLLSQSQPSAGQI